MARADTFGEVAAERRQEVFRLRLGLWAARRRCPLPGLFFLSCRDILDGTLQDFPNEALLGELGVVPRYISVLTTFVAC